MTDEALMLAVRDGDVARLGTLFERYHTALFDFLSRTTGDRAAAEDLVQDVFVRILKYRRTFRDDSSFEAWVFGITRNARADYFRKQQAMAPVHPSQDGAFDVAAPGPGPAQQFEAAREAARLKRALMRLDDDKRELLVLARFQRMSYERIGTVLGIEVGAVKVRVHRAVKQLREIFLQLNDGDETWNAKKSGTNLRII